MFTTNSYPQVYLTVNKNRRKLYGSSIYYLKDGEEFEFEFFNPTQDVFLAELELNGKPISNSGLILKPGERVYLERYIDNNKKFKFETYKIDGTEEALEATLKNGSVVVKFRRERITTNPTWKIRDIFEVKPFLGPTWTNWSDWVNNVNCSSKQMLDSCCCVDNKVETGRVEKGSNSNQTLEHVTGYSWDYATIETKFKILPESKKECCCSDLRVYCVNCGKKRHGSDNFCGKCGNKF